MTQRHLFLLLTLVVSHAFSAMPVEPIPIEMEGKYFEAVVDLQARRYEEALSKIEALLKNQADFIKLLELKALTLRRKGSYPEALQVYSDLILLAPKKGLTRGQLAPYYFDRAVIYFEQNNLELADKDFQIAYDYQFNQSTVLFYRARVAIENGDWIRARALLEKVVESKALLLKPPAHLLLAQTANELGDFTGVARNLAAARTITEKSIQDETTIGPTKELAREIFRSVEESIDPLKNSAWFGSLNLLSSMDSNTLLIPPGGTAPDGSTRLSTIRQAIQAEVGYASSALDSTHAVVRSQFYANINFNAATKGGQFVMNDTALYFTFDPLAPSRVGFKIKGNAGLQMSETASKYTGYLIGGGIGPFFRFESGPFSVWGIDLLIQYQKYLRDSEFATRYHKSGIEPVLKIFFRRDTRAVFWNPEVVALFNYFGAAGTEYKHIGLGGEFTNSFYLTKSFIIGAGVGYRLSSYSSRPDGSRTDGTITYRGFATLHASPRVQVSAEILSARNNSNVGDQYFYERTLGTLGLSYAF